MIRADIGKNNDGRVLMMEWFRQLGRAIRNLARIAREQPIWAVTALVTSPVALIRHLFGVLVLFFITALVLGLGVLILGKLLPAARFQYLPDRDDADGPGHPARHAARAVPTADPEIWRPCRR
jgi:hypothetical protein